jgi:hypothetical protein
MTEPERPVISEATLRTQVQLPHYTQCFLSPNITAGSLSAYKSCREFYEEQESLESPRAAFRNISTVHVDASKCQFYVNGTDEVQVKAKQMLEPFDIKLRPNSSDHDVFLQARLPVARICGCSVIKQAVRVVSVAATVRRCKRCHPA